MIEGYEHVEWRLRWQQFVEHLAVDPGWEWIDGETVAATREHVDDQLVSLREMAARDEPLVRDVTLHRCTLTYTPEAVDV